MNGKASIVLLTILALPLPALAADECVVKSEAADAVVALSIGPRKGRRYVVSVSKTRLTARIGAAKASKIPVDVDGPLRFTGDALELPLVFEVGTNTFDDVTRFREGAALEIVNARAATDAWSFDLAFRGDPSGAIVRGASFRCDDLALADGPTARQRADWAMTRTGLPAGDDGTRWVPRGKSLKLRGVAPGDPQVTVDLQIPSAFVLARFKVKGGEALVGREIGRGAFVVGWTEVRALVPYHEPQAEPRDEQDAVELGEEGGVAGGAVGGVAGGPPPPRLPDVVAIELAEGTPVRVKPGGPVWATIGKPGSYKALRFSDGNYALVGIPGLRDLPGAFVVPAATNPER